ncbi:MAG: CoA-binding protein [Deltaproteobacteria bacterium]|nr:CoA-binding protein [Deltaproteobacteria bacterium]
MDQGAARNPDDETLRELLRQTRRIAVVGISAREERAGCYVPDYLRRRGYEILPVNPTLAEWQGLRCYAALAEVPGPLELVNVFRRSEEAGAVVDQAIAAGARAVWLQLGVADDAAMRRARAAGLVAVQDLCLMVEHQRLLR